MASMKTRKNISLGVFIVLNVLLILFLINRIKVTDRRSYLWEIKGTVERMEYCPKTTPTIWVNEQEYYLDAFYVKKKDSIKVGDYIVKRHKEKVLYHYKYDSKGEKYLYGEHKLWDGPIKFKED